MHQECASGAANLPGNGKVDAGISPAMRVPGKTQYRALQSFKSAVKTSGRTFFVEGGPSVPAGITVFAATGASRNLNRIAARTDDLACS